MTVKAGQKCTAIRRAIVPRKHLDAVAAKLRARLAKTVVGDPALEGVRMGALASQAQQRDVAERVGQLARGKPRSCSASATASRRWATASTEGRVLRADAAAVRDADDQRRRARHRGLRPGQHADAVRRPRRGAGAGRARPRQPGRRRWSRATRRSRRTPIPIAAAHHGRLLVLDREAAAESTGHGSPLPLLKHGGPGRAGGGEELGGMRAVKHYLQRAAVQGSPTMLAAVTGEYVRGAQVQESDVHPFRKHFEDLQVGDSLLTHRRTVERGRHRGLRRHLGRLLLHALRRDRGQGDRSSASASRTATSCCRRRPGLFVSPAPGPVLANYGLDTLRFVKPVGIGDTIRARLTCKRKIDRQTEGRQGRRAGRGRLGRGGDEPETANWSRATTS